jgi:putative ABC transport system permease protein
MSPPRWATALLRRLAPPPEAEILVGDLEEAHRARVARRGAHIASVLTWLEALDIAFMLVRRWLRLPRWSMSWLDVKLAVRMLVRYPVLTLIGIGSLAAAIALGASAFAFITLFLWPRMPLPDGDQVVVVLHRDVAANQDESRVTADYFRWRGGTSTLTDFAAGRGMGRNLVMGDGIAEPISVAEVTASMFPMARVAPIMGRVLTDDDATSAAPPVMLLGERIWRESFSADPAIVGKTLLVSETPTTVVGVMPAQFRFPSIYEVWQPLKIEEAAAKPRVGMGIRIWARLKSNMTREQADTELAVLSAQAAADWPATHEHLRASVGSPVESDVSNPEERALIASANIFVALLVLLVSGNVALLMFARAATRESEIIVRTALGASRGRLVAQFLAEALALSTIAAVIGLVMAQQVMVWGVTTFTVVANGGELLPFWITPSLPPLSIVYGIGLAILAAAVTGILPAVKMTRAVSSRLRETTAGGGGLSFGGIWTVIIVLQIAVTMAFPAIMYFLRAEAHRTEAQQIGVPPERYLSARLGRDSSMTQARFEATVRRVREDLAETPGVVRVTVADKLPFMWNGHYLIEVDEGGAAAPAEGEFGGSYRITTAAVEADFFAAFEAPALAGRLFVASDFAGAPRLVIVNQSFVEKVLGGRSAVGRRIRYRWTSGEGQGAPATNVLPPGSVPPWVEIVGVVRDLGMSQEPNPNTAGVYFPLTLRTVSAVMVAARVSGEMAEATNALRAAARNADPTLRVSDVQPLSRIPENGLRTVGYVVRMLGIAGGVGIMLALSGIYAVMSFAVSRRTREIGIRVALGSSRSRVVFTILRRPLMQVAMGSALGPILFFTIPIPIAVTPAYVMGMTGYTVLMFGVCMLACLVPVRRVLRVDPIAALRTE